MIQTINSKDNARVKYAYSLKMGKFRHLHHQFLIEGKKNVEMALKANKVEEIFSLKPLDNVSKSVKQYLVNQQIVEKLTSNKNPDGIIAICHFLDYEIKEDFHKVVYLDHLSDPGNIGTIIRTSLALGYDAVILSENSCDLYNEKVIAASKGSIFFIPVFEGNLKDLLPNHQVVVTHLSDKTIDVENAKKALKKDFVIVFGNESKGASQDIIKEADLMVKIPIEKIDSLNVSVAAGIVLYLFR